MRPVTIMLFMPLLCTVLVAQDFEQLRGCLKNADSQTAMNICAGEEVQRVNAEANDIYRKVLAAAADSRDEPDAAAKIAAAEKAWLAYRDAYMEVVFPAKDKQAVYGSIFPTTADFLLATLTRHHIDALNDLLRHYTGVPGY